ncbi:hypothetical protein HGRIS_006168 [Hohenbuehelia grisea]|uniref:Protein ste16 n=1 Tax=Hohenbuehelia grisea TaxID=104357 RepID=A0ABR3K064_9AGAR
MPALLAVPTPASPNSSSLASSTATLTNHDSFLDLRPDPKPNLNAPTNDSRPDALEIEAVRTRLSMECSIRDGAEELLKNKDISDTLRVQVQSELNNAKVKIDALEKQLQTYLLDDSRAALQQALKCIEQLRQPHEGPSSSSSSSPKATASQQIEIMNKLTAILQRHLRIRYELDLSEVLQQVVIPSLTDRSSKHCRASAYRVIRHLLVDRESVQRIGQSLDWYIVKALCRDNKFAVEKEQVIKLIRAIVEVGTVQRDTSTDTQNVLLSEPVMRALLAVAEHPEDPFRTISILTLSEILLLDIDLVGKIGGIRFLLHACGEGPVELAPIIAATFLHIADSPRTRSYLHVGTDLELALSAVMDAYGKPSDHVDRMRSCIKVIQVMLRTWSGLMYFCMNDMSAIRGLVDTLRIPSLDTRDIILDMFFELFHIKVPDWHKQFLIGRRLTRVHNQPLTSMNENQGTESDVSDRASHRLKLTDQYIGLLILVFTNAGLLDALTSMLEETINGTELSRKATLLMAETLQMANRVLPLSVAARIQSIPQVFDLASDFQHGENRIIGTSLLSGIDSFNRNRTRLEPSTTVKNTRPRANSVEDSGRRQRQIEQVKIKLGMQMDEKAFLAALNESQISSTKEHARWNFEVLIELVEGPLRNPSRLEEAIKASRIIKRLMSFYHPRSHRFSDIPRSKSNVKWIRLGCALLTTLLSNADGVRYLATEDVFLQQIVWGFSQLDPFNGPPDSDPIFSKTRIAETLTYGYLEMLGTLSKHKEGVELLEKFKVFTAFYHLSELRSREDLIKGIIENLDYSIDGHPRIVLSKALTSSYKHIRLYATRHLGALIRSSTNSNAWTLRLLVTQLYDPAPEVCELAAHFLGEACESKDVLNLVVEMQPMLDHLGEIGHPLLMKFTSTPMGFRYLYDTGYIDREMDMWYHERNVEYVVQVEVFLAKVFHASSSSDDNDDVLAFDGTVPPHFYGEMAKTELGCQVLQDKGHFADFADFIRQHSNESEDADLIMKLKSILWAVGNVGATDGGLPFLEEEEVIPAILEIAEQSPIPSVRGTCFFVLGLISTTSQGAEILDDYRWEATLSPLGLPTGLCMPMDVDKFISIPPWKEREIDPCSARLTPPTSEVELEIMTAIQNLANTVIANAASRSLVKMKSRPEYKHIFSSPTLCYRALHTISTQRYRLPVRRFIFDLFTIELNSEVVATFASCDKSLQAKPSSSPVKPDSNRISIFGRLGRRRASESDDEEDELDPVGNTTYVAPEQPAITLRPVSRIIGFAL